MQLIVYFAVNVHEEMVAHSMYPQKPFCVHVFCNCSSKDPFVYRSFCTGMDWHKHCCGNSRCAEFKKFGPRKLRH